MRPFRDGDVSSTFRNLIDKTTAEIHSLNNEYVLKASPTELEQHYIEKVMIDPLVLNAEERYIKDQTGIQIDVSHDIRRGIFPGERVEVKGTRLDIAIPFEGNPILWQIRASTYSLGGYPDIDIRGNEVIFGVSFPDDSTDQESLRSEIERETNSLIAAVGYLKADVDNHNNSAPGTIRQALARKRQLAQSVVGAVASLGIPMKRSETQAHLQCRTVLRNESGDSRYVLVKDSDPGREITVTVQVYDVPKG